MTRKLRQDNDHSFSCRLWNEPLRSTSPLPVRSNNYQNLSNTHIRSLSTNTCYGGWGDHPLRVGHTRVSLRRHPKVEDGSTGILGRLFTGTPVTWNRPVSSPPSINLWRINGQHENGWECRYDSSWTMEINSPHLYLRVLSSRTEPGTSTFPSCIRDTGLTLDV